MNVLAGDAQDDLLLAEDEFACLNDEEVLLLAVEAMDLEDDSDLSDSSSTADVTETPSASTAKDMPATASTEFATPDEEGSSADEMLRRLTGHERINSSIAAQAVPHAMRQNGTLNKEMKSRFTSAMSHDSDSDEGIRRSAATANAESIQDGSAQRRPANKAAARRAARLVKLQRQDQEEGTLAGSMCRVCALVFESKTQLFKHLHTSGHTSSKETDATRVGKAEESAATHIKATKGKKRIKKSKVLV